MNIYIYIVGILHSRKTMGLCSECFVWYSVGCGWPIQRGNLLLPVFCRRCQAGVTSPEHKAWVSKYGEQAVTHAARR